MAETPTPKQYQVRNAFELKGETKLPGEKLMLDDESGANSLYDSGHIAHFDEELPPKP